MQQKDSRSALVTGGTGFVGSHLVERLIAKGYDVTCLVRDPARLRWLTGLDVRLAQGDCSRPETLASAVKNVLVVFHAAGLTKARRPREYYDVNHIGTRNILEACGRHNPGLRKFVLVSSLAAAGPSRDGRPVKDTDPAGPVSDYGRSKALAEEEARAYKDVFPVAILRPSAVYGPRDTDMFEFFRWAARGLTVGFTGGERFINLCFVGDLAEALLLAAERETPSGSIYFVAEDRAYSWSEFGESLLRAGNVKARRIAIPPWAGYLTGLAWELGSLFTGKPAITNRQKVREALQKYWICDLRKIEKDLGFRAAHPLAQGLAITWRWYREKGWIR